MGSRTGFTSAGGAAERGRSRTREFVEAVLVALVFLVFARAFVLELSEVPSGSMADTVLEGDYVLVNRFVYAPSGSGLERAWLPLRPIRRGDVVVFAHPEQPEQEVIKRVVGMPGETVALREGRVLIDGRPLAEPYVNPLYLPRDGFDAVPVGPGRLFVLGDHRNHSSDSREWGALPAELVRGRAAVVLLSTRRGPTETDDPARVTPRSIARRLRDLVFRSRLDRSLMPIR